MLDFFACKETEWYCLHKLAILMLDGSTRANLYAHAPPSWWGHKNVFLEEHHVSFCFDRCTECCMVFYAPSPFPCMHIHVQVTHWQLCTFWQLCIYSHANHSPPCVFILSDPLPPMFEAGFTQSAKVCCSSSIDWSLSQMVERSLQLQTFQFTTLVLCGNKNTALQLTCLIV